MSRLVHDKGISRIIGLDQTEKGAAYLGFKCKNCGMNIYCFTDVHHDKRPLGRPIVEGKGLFSVPCKICKVDNNVFKTHELISMVAETDSNTATSLKRTTPSGKARQKLSNRYPDATATFGRRFIEDRPECAIIIARCIATWSYVEHETALLLSVLLKINTKPALAMFIAMQSSRTQIPVLTAAAKAVLEQDDFILFLAIMDVRKTMQKSRDDLAHGLFGGSLQVAEGILWAQQADMVRHTATVRESDFEQMETEYKSAAFVYEAGDLETIAQNLEWLHQFLSFFAGYLTADDKNWRRQRYRELSDAPQIREALQRVRAKEKKSNVEDE